METIGPTTTCTHSSVSASLPRPASGLCGLCVSSPPTAPNKAWPSPSSSDFKPYPWPQEKRIAGAPPSESFSPSLVAPSVWVTSSAFLVSPRNTMEPPSLSHTSSLSFFSACPSHGQNGPWADSAGNKDTTPAQASFARSGKTALPPTLAS